MKKIVLILLAGILSTGTSVQSQVKQKDIRLVQYMPNMPSPYKMKNWKEIATQQDKLFYDFNAKGQNLPLI